MLATAEMTAEKNGVADRIHFHHEAVDGDTELPDCDVLEIDCEGCEPEVMEHLDIGPRVVIVEHHDFLDAGAG